MRSWRNVRQIFQSFRAAVSWRMVRLTTWYGQLHGFYPIVSERCLKMSAKHYRCFVMSIGFSFILLAMGQAQEYTLDASHTAVTFQIGHLGLSWTHGRFNNVTGQFIIDSQSPANSRFTVRIAADSIDTGNQQRDDHLRSPDFLNVKQFPEITFQSTSVTPINDGLSVTGNFTMHGVTKVITLELRGGKTAEFPAGVQRTGFTASRLVIKRSEFDMAGMSQAIGDDVFISISFEGTQQ